jgi:hypothetical protein
MNCKIFYASRRELLQKEVNEWLQTHPVSPESMHFQFSTVLIESDIDYKLEHTLVLFYVPMRII